MAIANPRHETGTWLEKGPFSIRTEREPEDLYVVELYGEFDLSAAELATPELERVQQSDVKEIIVDLSGLEFIDSTGLSALCQIYRKEKEGDNRVILLRPEGLVQRVFELTGLSDTLPFAD
jgi:anti-sigma B factor antagonist